jgi:hypothetical protein
MGSRDAVFGLLAGEPLPVPGGTASNLTVGDGLAPWLAGMIPTTPVSSLWFGSDHGATSLTESALADEESKAPTATDAVFAGLGDDAATEG